MARVTADQVAFKDYMKEFNGDPIEQLEYVLDWIRDNLVVDDVFSEDEIATYLS